jgi:hypothetical protein
VNENTNLSCEWKLIQVQCEWKKIPSCE